MKKNVKYRVLGIMSGTSIDGIDLAITTFFKKNKSWHYNVEKCKTIEYSKYWKSTPIISPVANLVKYFCF